MKAPSGGMLRRLHGLAIDEGGVEIRSLPEGDPAREES